MLLGGGRERCIGNEWVNPDPNKPAEEALFSRKKKESIHPVISLNNIQVEKASYQKHLEIFIDGKLTFKYHVDNTLCKVKPLLHNVEKWPNIL